MCCSATREMLEKELMSLSFDIYENAIDELSFAFSAMISFLDCLHEEVIDVGNSIPPGTVYDKRTKNGLLRTAIYHLYSASELLFKAALYNKREIIFEQREALRKTCKLKCKKIDPYNFKEMYFNDIAILLKAVYDIPSYDQESKEAANIFQLKHWRNLIEHNSINVNIRQAICVWFGAWEELSRFCSRTIIDVLTEKGLQTEYDVVCKEYLGMKNTYQKILQEMERIISLTDNISDSAKK